MFKYTILILALMSCADKEEIIPAHKIVAKVNDDILSKDELSSLTQLKVAEQENNDIVRLYAKQWIQNSILAQEAEKLGYSLSESEKFALENLKKEYLVEKFINARLNDLSISDREVQDYYNEHKAEFKYAEDEYHLIHLFTPKRTRSIQSEINKEKDLLAVIKKFHLIKTVNDELLNGDLGFVKGKQLGKELLKRVKRAKLKQVYGPIRINKAFHYFEVKEQKIAGSFIPLEQVKQDIKERLLSSKVSELRHRIVQELKSKYVIKNKF